MVRTRRKGHAPEGSTRAKGDILEEIVAEMHDIAGVVVERNASLPVRDGSNRKREIDVLITTETLGIPIRIAIECKNESEKTGIEKIDSFIGKLQDINVPTQLGIYVSKRGYTSGALKRAQDVGIKTLTLRDTPNGISETVIEAFQSTVYFLLAITNIQIRNNIAPGKTVLSGDLLFFRNKEGKICGSIPDLVWQKWITGKISLKLGEGRLQPKVPSGWKQVIRGQNVEINEITVSYKITGFGISIPGAVTQYQLVNAVDQTLHKARVTAKFPRPHERLLLSQLDNEEDLVSFEAKQGQILIVNRVRTPRIRWLAMYWPPSSTTISKLNQRMLIAHQAGENFDLNMLSLAEIEGDSLSKLWEPIVGDHPMIKQIQKTRHSKTS